MKAFIGIQGHNQDTAKQGHSQLVSALSMSKASPKKATNILKASEGSPGPFLSDDELRFALCASPQTIFLENFLVVFTANSQS